MTYGAGASKTVSGKMAEKSAKRAALQQDLLTGQAPLEPHIGCIAAAMEIVGNKWTALILRDLVTGPKRFGELEKSVGTINPRTLSQRLDDLEAHGIVTKESFAEVPPRCEYTLTQKGEDLIPVLRQMAEWGNKYSEATA